MQDRNPDSLVDGRRRFIRTGLGVAGGLALPAGFASQAFAADQPPIGTWPAGVVRQLGLHRHHACRAPAPTRCRARTSSRATSSPIEHINAGHPLIKQISPKTNEGRARQGAEVRRRRLGRQAERRGAGAAALHHREQGDHDHRRHLERGRRGAEQARPAREGAVRRAASPAPTTPPARTACATACARTSTARRRPTRSARRCSRPTARTRRRRS